MNKNRQNAIETTKYLVENSGKRPKTAILTGTGLKDIAAFVNVTHEFGYAQIPHFPISTVQSHSGKLLIGNFKEKDIIVFQGRFHLYEGYCAQEVVYPVRVMQEMGVETLILSNASGGLKSYFSPGDIMVITDHINLTGENPLVGINEENWGNRFPDMTGAYDRKLSSLAEKIGKTQNVSIQKGVYAGLKGPSLETPAEVRFLQIIGAEAVGFSTVQEVIAAVHGGIRVLGLSTITNVHDPDNPTPSTVDEIIAVAETTTPKLETIIRQVIERTDERETS